MFYELRHACMSDNKIQTKSKKFLLGTRKWKKTVMTLFSDLGHRFRRDKGMEKKWHKIVFGTKELNQVYFIILWIDKSPNQSRFQYFKIHRTSVDSERDIQEVDQSCKSQAVFLSLPWVQSFSVSLMKSCPIWGMPYTFPEHINACHSNQFQ
jgi:hypothetical protein